MPPLILGLTGSIGSGKTTAAEYLVLNHDFVTHSFANRIKKGVAAIFGCHIKDLDDQEFKQSCPEGFTVTYRHILRTLGTEWGRNCVDERVWEKLTRDSIGREYLPVVVSDVRFENEAEAVRAMGGIIVHIDTPEPAEHSDHPSDAGVRFQAGDETLHNPKTRLQDFYSEIEQLMERIYERKNSNSPAGTTD